MRHKLVVWFLLLLTGFLIGFILQYSRLRQVQQELSVSTKLLGFCQSSQKLSQLRDTATMMYLEVVQKNYGKAGEQSKDFFDQAQQIASSIGRPRPPELASRPRRGVRHLGRPRRPEGDRRWALRVRREAQPRRRPRGLPGLGREQAVPGHPRHQRVRRLTRRSTR